ncbi:hypothetical protein, partial [Streptomyces durbertensis]|uniref:hypothetical protein n=1 Tax=Streptomyces durbertensis TaxID=2448886 RepID=UPI001888E813
PKKPSGKSSFDDIYDQPDPRGYYRALRPYDYQVPHHAQTLVRRLLGTKPLVAAGERGPLTVLDVCCSYGVNAALFNHTVTLQDLYRHYADLDSQADAGTDAARLAGNDRAYFAERRRYDAVRALGLDAAGNAVAYARSAGLLDRGFAENLERDEPSGELRRALADVSLVTVTGGVGYVTGRTFARLAAHLPDRVWVLALVLRTVSYDDISAALAARGLRTVRADTTYVQRRFTDPEEQRNAVAAVTAAGLSPEGLEADGRFHAQLYLSGPAEPSGELLLPEVLSEIVSG